MLVGGVSLLCLMLATISISEFLVANYGLLTAANTVTLEHLLQAREMIEGPAAAIAARITSGLSVSTETQTPSRTSASITGSTRRK